MSFAVGALVKVRGREWVVLPESEDDLLMLRPLGGTDDEVTGIYIPLEKVEHATFDLPSPSEVGDYRSCRLLRDAVRLGFRSSAGPFRSFAQLAVEPRPYQLVPLLMALKLDPVRLLIADDVGIGKTVESCLVARELLDRGEIQRLAVLCPPHLTEQWQVELQEKFHIRTELVLASTAKRLERNCGINKSIFDVYPFVIVSMDYIKSDRRRDDFLRTCPDLVIVDEAHTCVFSGEGRGSRHQRNLLLQGLAQKPDRHIILVTATPHSGKEDAFRRLLAFLNPNFSSLPDDLSGEANVNHRKNLAKYFVQRRRADIRDYMDEDTTFPTRLELEEDYTLHPDYKKFFDRVLSFAQETVREAGPDRKQQRVMWWSALALLRSLASSPAAAVQTLKSRASTAEAESIEDADEIGRRSILDLEGDDEAERMDIAPGADASELTSDEKNVHRRLRDMARQAEQLKGKKDKKLQKIIEIIKSLLGDKFHPIVFCRFIPTAEYLAEELRSRLKGVEVISVTGKLPPEERENRVKQLGESAKRILVCTDCLSEGINLQDHFDAVIHYDLSWNPTRHEQREGRVDRFGQPRDEVRVVTYYGTDNQIDGIVLDVLLRKHKTIRSSLGISVPVPVDTNKVVEAIFEGLLLRGRGTQSQAQLLPGFDEYLKPQKKELFEKWENASEREKRSRTMFAQRSIKAEDVARELSEVRKAIGAGVDVSSFMDQAVKILNGLAEEQADGSRYFDLSVTPKALYEMLPKTEFMASFNPSKVQEDQIYLNRTHPIVESVASFIMDSALDPLQRSAAKRSGVIRTGGVERRTIVLLVRFRYHIISTKGETETPLLAEDCQVVGFTGSPGNAEWLSVEQAEKLLTVRPEANIPPDVARHQLQGILDDFDKVMPHLEELTKNSGKELLESHRRVRKAAQARGIEYRVEPKLPPDILGLYVYLPRPEAA